MSNAALSQLRPPQPLSANAAWSIATVVAVWLAIVWFLGTREFFVAEPGTPPFPILIAYLGPIIAFSIALRRSQSLRELVMNFDLRTTTAIQAWRMGGFGFLALYAWGILPGAFAFPAGLGDMAIGATAPLVALALIRHPDFAASRTFRVWNILGMLDLVAAVVTGAIVSTLLTGAGDITTAPMAQMPLVLIPAFAVPLFAILHLSALFQSRHR